LQSLDLKAFRQREFLTNHSVVTSRNLKCLESHPNAGSPTPVLRMEMPGFYSEHLIAVLISIPRYG